MSEIQDYKSSIKFETFSYLPELTPDEIRKQVAYIVSKGWNPGIEHVEVERSFNYYWYMWKLPMFGEHDIDRVLSELEACHRAHPTHHVRLIGYDNYAQSQGLTFVVYRGQ